MRSHVCPHVPQRSAILLSNIRPVSLKRSIPTFISFAGWLWQCVWSSAYHSRNFCVVRNATGTITYALSRGLEKEYAHANLFSSGSTLFSLLRAVRRGNSQCGRAMIKQGHSRTSDTCFLDRLLWTRKRRALEFNDIAVKQLERN